MYDLGQAIPQKRMSSRMSSMSKMRVQKDEWKSGNNELLTPHDAIELFLSRGVTTTSEQEAKEISSNAERILVVAKDLAKKTGLVFSWFYCKE